ncbi:MAG TPA: triple tyrosine motif-containing protein, partial [Puia sp.]|nr:triple tyrosine motif-containing protein [Puia sp.]
TEAGVSRFDGTHFRNFTTVDGLPDVEVLEMFADSRGRVWMAPFRKSLCYFYKGKICNQENDPLLHNIRLRNTIHGFAEDRAGDVLAATRTALFLIKPDGRVREIDSLNGRPLQNCGAIATGNDGNFLVQSANEVYRLSGEKFTPLYAISIQDSWPFYISMNSAGMIWRRDSVSAAVHSFSTGKTVYLPFERVHYRHNTFTSLGDSLFCFNENNGVNEYNLFTGQFRRMLPGKQVSRSFRDAAGNTWFTTIGQGIYRLNSDEFRSIRLSTPHSVSSSIQAIRRIGDMLLVGGDLNYIFVFRFPAMSLNKTVAFSGGIKNRITYFGTASNGNVYVVTDGGIRWLSRDFRTFGAAFTGAKACLPFGSGKLLIATYWGVGIFDLHSFKILDTIFRERTTALYYHRDTILVGTLEGLYGIAPDRSVHFLGKSIPFLRRRISALTESADGTLWVASYDAGIIGYKDGAVIARFGKQQGLSSDICRTVLIHNNALWVGTDKGLTKVSLNRPGYPMEHYTSQDGLGSDIINTIYADGPVIYVGTPVGFSMFDETRIDVSESCRLYLLSIQNGDRERIGDSASLLLPYMDKHLRLEFAGISYRSVGDITYQYRLVGLDSAWRTTRESFLEYPTLPSGKYQLQLQAVNKFGVQSNIVTLPFEVETPWWQTTLFYILQVAVFLSITWLGVSLRIRQIRNRQREKEKLNQRMMKMEHMALQAQMNPHFIFN